MFIFSDVLLWCICAGLIVYSMDLYYGKMSFKFQFYIATHHQSNNKHVIVYTIVLVKLCTVFIFDAE